MLNARAIATLWITAVRGKGREMTGLGPIQGRRGSKLDVASMSSVLRTRGRRKPDRRPRHGISDGSNANPVQDQT